MSASPTRIFAALLVTSATACSLFVGLDGLSGGPATNSNDAALDATSGDGAVLGDGAPSDAIAPLDSSFDAGAPIECSTLDATFCDTFDRDAALATGAPWASVQDDAKCVLTVSGQLTTAYPATSTYSTCYLQSQPVNNLSKFTLDFDTSFDTVDTASQSQVTLAAVELDLAHVNDGGVLNVSFQLLVDATGGGALGMIPYYPDAGQSPQPGNSYPFFALVQTDKFLKKATPCHVTIAVDALAPASATVTAKCQGLLAVSMTPSGDSIPKEFAATGVVLLGYTDTGGSTVSAWTLSYDNMVFRRSP